MEKPTFRLQHIVLTEAFFKRDILLDDTYSKATNFIDVTSQRAAVIQNDFGVYLTVHLKQTFEQKDLVEIKITMSGAFQKNENVDEQSLSNFCDVNAPAIIFPFIRETIASLTSKAGIHPILIQPMNFVEMAKTKSGQK